MNDSTRLEIYGVVVKYDTKISGFSDERLNDKKPMYIKRALKAYGYPKVECDEYASHFTAIQKEAIKKTIDKETLLIVAPSTSRENPFPELFARNIKELTHCKVNESSSVSVVKAVRSEAKNAYTLEKRNERFAPYKINVDLLKEQCKGYKKIVLVDDIITTGETVINLAMQLKANGIPVTGAIAMIPFSTKYPTNEKLAEFSKKVLDEACIYDRPKNKIRTSVENAMKNVFGDYLDIRMKHEIREKTFDTKAKARKLCSNALKANENIIILKTKIEVNKDLNLGR